jgi:hypothetical protein
MVEVSGRPDTRMRRSAMTSNEAMRSAKLTNAQAMAAHVAALAEHHGVEIQHYTGGGVAYPSERRVSIRPVKGPSTYFVALHELGHIVGRGRSARKLEAEANAWAWALDVAIRPPTRAVRRQIASCLQRYLYAGRRNWGLRQNMVEPPEDHVFWRLANIPSHVRESVA